MTFDVGEVRVNVSFFFFVTVCVSLVLDKTNTAALALCAAAIHEGGHLLCMLAFGERARKIHIAPFGFGITRTGMGSYRREMCIALAGPAANLLAAAVLICVMLCCNKRGLFKAAVVNISLAVFNLLPIEPLDLGRAVRCRLMCSMNSARADRLIFALGIVFLIPLVTFGFLVLIKSRYNITLLLASIYLAFSLLKRSG